MKNSKGKRTTMISIAGLIVFMTVLAFYFFGKKDMSSEDFTVIITSVIAFFTFLIGLSAKDSNQSHSIKTGDNPPEEDEQNPPG